MPLPPLWVMPASGSVAFAATALAETVVPLRPRVEPRVTRLFRNAVIAVLGLLLFGILRVWCVLPVAAWVERSGIGAARLIAAPAWVRTALAVLLLDYTLWIWHWANHRVPFLWRFHLVHHVDRDLDASTALRFHFGEMALSVPYRAVQVVIAGADPFALWLWESILLVSILFHHSNARLPIAFERVLVRLVVTPRMHGIHHSDRLDEANSNWSSLLSVWDALHRTLRLDVPQKDVVIGVPAYAAPADVTLGKSLTMPFLPQRRDFAAPDGTLLVRGHGSGSSASLRA